MGTARVWEKEREREWQQQQLAIRCLSIRLSASLPGSTQAKHLESGKAKAELPRSGRSRRQPFWLAPLRASGAISPCAFTHGAYRWLTAKLAPKYFGFDPPHAHPDLDMHCNLRQTPRANVYMRTYWEVLGERVRGKQIRDARFLFFYRKCLNIWEMGGIAPPAILHSTDINRSSQDTQQPDGTSAARRVGRGAGACTALLCSQDKAKKKKRKRKNLAYK